MQEAYSKRIYKVNMFPPCIDASLSNVCYPQLLWQGLGRLETEHSSGPERYQCCTPVGCYHLLVLPYIVALAQRLYTCLHGLAVFVISSFVSFALLQTGLQVVAGSIM